MAMKSSWRILKTCAGRAALALLAVTASNMANPASATSQLEDVIKDVTRQLLEEMKRNQSQPGQTPTQPQPKSPPSPSTNQPGPVNTPSAASQSQPASGVEVTLNGTRPDGSNWDDALPGILVFNVRGVIPDVQVCLAPSTSASWEDCAPVCQDNRTCSAPFAQPGDAISVYEVDKGSRETVLFRHPIAGCSPSCTVPTPGGSVQVKATFQSVARKSDCVIYNANSATPGFPQPLAKAMKTLLSSGGNMARRFSRFDKRSGRLATCRSVTYPAAYIPDIDTIRFSEQTALTESEDSLLRTLFEEIAHATTKVSLSDPRVTNQNTWIFEYQDKLLRFEAWGWILALLERERFIAAGLASPPVITFSGPSASDRAKMERIAKDLRAGKLSSTQAIRKMVPFVSNSYTTYTGRPTQARSPTTITTANKESKFGDAQMRALRNCTPQPDFGPAIEETEFRQEWPFTARDALGAGLAGVSIARVLA